MSHTNDTHAEHDGGAIAEIKKVTIILSVLTIVELILGFWMIGMESILHCCLLYALKA
jgi:cytochrome c oxidase subunit 4